MIHNEDSRVKIPAIVHLTKLGYEYISLRTASWNLDTNIFEDIFSESISRINPDITKGEIKRLLEDIFIDLSNDDLGKAFYKRLSNRSGVKLIDFDDFENNSFHVCTELTYKNGDDEFRPDVITLINGMPLSFIEVKKPSNRDGILAERKRIETRFSNKRFRKFVNLTQLLVFSNNMEYPESQAEPLMGVFYSSTAYGKPMFNYFREEVEFDLDKELTPITSESIDKVLTDNNLNSIKHSEEFQTNLNLDSPTNRVLTSLFKKDRL